MTDGDSIAQVAVVILLLSLAVPALATAHETAGTPLGYSEQTTVDYATPYDVEENATVEGYGNDPVVLVDGDTLVRGSDYSWNASAGRLSFTNTTNTSAGETATVEYRAYQRTEETAAAWTILAPLMSLFGLFGLVVSVRALLPFIGEVFGR